MARLSRPYQIALVVVAVLFAAWFVLLRSHGSSPGASASATPGSSAVSSASGASSGGSSSASGGSSGAAEQARGAAQPSKVYKGSAPGLHGLSKDVRKAHEAVGTSQRQAASEEASPAGSGSGKASATAPGASASAGATGGTQAATSNHQGNATAAHGSPAVKSQAGSSSGATKHVPAGGQSASTGSGHGQAATGSSHRSPAVVLASQLDAGKVVLLLFWNPHSSDDAAVHSQVQAVAHAMGRKVAVHFAKAGEVGSFGTVTRAVSVYQTPTLLVIGKKGLTSTITGLTDAFAIEQAVREAER